MPRTSIVLLVFALLFTGAASWLLWQEAGERSRGYALIGHEVPVGGPFALVDQDGHKRTDKDFRGRWMLVYFGYTFCPDVCPTTLALMANTLGKLGPRVGRVAPIFVTVDPARDTPSVLKPYVAAFGPSFVGLTGTPTGIAEIARAYDVYYAKHPLAGGGYSVDHSSTIYLMDPRGAFVRTYDDQDTANAIADDLKKRI